MIESAGGTAIAAQGKGTIKAYIIIGMSI